MSRLFKVGMGALAAVTMSAHLSVAADLDPPAPIIEHKPISVGGGFYLRGDIGYSIWENPDLSFRNDVAGFSSAIDNEDSDDAIFGGVGVGYKFKKYLRVDLTADLRKNKDIDGSIQCGACLAFASIPDTTLQQRTNVDIATFFANAYVDVGTFKGFTPYVGGGVGFAYLNYGDYLSLGNPTAGNTPGGTPQDLAAANPSGIANQVFAGADDIRFAWNLQAGASYDINENLALDGSYRYTRINGGDVAPDIGGVGALVSDDLVGHEIRLGLRYTFGGGKKHYGGNSVFK
ncbi:MAG: outer membrane beta-barrel protein [Hyphomicrobiales bacterium]